MKIISILLVFMFVINGFGFQPPPGRKPSAKTWAQVAATTTPQPPVGISPRQQMTRTKSSVRYKKPAAAALILPKRSSDSDDDGAKPAQRRRMSNPKDLLVEEIETGVREGGLNILSANPPICEVVVQNAPHRCKYYGIDGCHTVFCDDNQDERSHVEHWHGIIAADPEQDGDIDWDLVLNLKLPDNYFPRN